MKESPLLSYLLHLADDSLILAQRNGEWCGHGPILEQDIAITNISLDLVGQARNFYQYAAELIGEGASEDSLAYLRNSNDFKNCLLVELPKGDWGFTILRQLFFSTYQHLLYTQLCRSTDKTIAAIAEKSLKEVTYHVRWSSEWVIRLGDGTEESRGRMVKAMEELWMYTGEMFMPVPYELESATKGVGADIAALKSAWEQRINAVLNEATLPLPKPGAWMQTGGKEGVHTEHFGHLLAELQYMQRAYPGVEW